MSTRFAALVEVEPPRESPPTLLRLTNFLGYLLLVLVNVLASTGAFGDDNATISARYPTPLTPAGWAFSVWGLIFALQGAGVMYQLLHAGFSAHGWKTFMVLRIGYWWQAGWMAQDAWQIAFSRQSAAGMIVALVALVAALASFQVALHRLNGSTQQLRARGYGSLPVAAYVLYKLPTAINAAWLSVATALGVLIVPVAYGVEQGRLVLPAALLAGAVTCGGIWRLVRHLDVAYGCTLIWALSAVAANDSGRVPKAVKVAGVVCLVPLALFVLLALARTRRALARSGGGGGGQGGGAALGDEDGDAAAAGDEAAAAGRKMLVDAYGSTYEYDPAADSDRRTLLSSSDPPGGGASHVGVRYTKEGVPYGALHTTTTFAAVPLGDWERGAGPGGPPAAAGPASALGAPLPLRQHVALRQAAPAAGEPAEAALEPSLVATGAAAGAGGGWGDGPLHSTTALALGVTELHDGRMTVLHGDGVPALPGGKGPLAPAPARAAAPAVE